MRSLKKKVDVYFDVDGCVDSQLWFYGTTAFVSVITLSMILGIFK